MTTITIYGSTTSPFVRRVRVAALECGAEITLVDSTREDGKARLDAATPIGKVPAAEVDGQVVWDSGNILDLLHAVAPSSALRPLPSDPHARAAELNFIHAVDEMTLAAVRLFYLERDGVVATGAYLDKERSRVPQLLGYLAAQLRGPDATATTGFGRAELALVTSLDWLTFRRRADVDAYPALRAFLDAHASRPSLASTLPGV